jgi:hypothetical protein
MRLLFAISALVLVGCTDTNATTVSENDILAEGAYGDCSTVSEMAFEGASKQHKHDIKINYNGNTLDVETRSFRKLETSLKSQDGDTFIVIPKDSITKITTPRGTEFLRADENTRLIVTSGETYTCRFAG